MGLHTLGDRWPGARPAKVTPPTPDRPAPVLCPRTGKIKHPRKIEALTQLESLLDVSPDEELTTFQCPFCHGWHVGHITSGRKKGR